MSALLSPTISPETVKVDPAILACPACGKEVSVSAPDQMRCGGCTEHYPLVDGIPVLINEANSLFRQSDFTGKQATFFRGEGSIRERILGLLPSMSKNFWAKTEYRKVKALLMAKNPRPRVLIIGGSILGAGMEEFRADPDIEFVDSDVSHGPLTKIICDGHDLPFKSESFDAVVAQAVFEHVADPVRVVSEVRRVLKAGGLIYADTPFLQPAHATPFDFHRFTFVGYRQLFAGFDRISLQPMGGPGHALGHAWESFWICMSDNRALRGGFYIFARLTGFWIKYLDLYLNNKAHSLHVAFGLLFVGRKRESPLSLSEIIADVKGL
jgi:SAM-dependent methyltransferase